MENKATIEQINLADRAIRVVSEDGFFRAVAVKNSLTARTAQLNHQYPAELSLHHAEVLAAASLMSAFLKGEERVIVDISGDGKIEKLYAEAMPIGETRGFGRINPEFTGKYFNSLLKVSRIMYGEPEPITGIVEFPGNKVQDTIAEYLTMSEQIPSIVSLDACVDSEGIIEQSGGLIVQAMPGASQADIEQVRNSINKAKPITDYFKEKMRPDQLLKEILPFNFQTVKSTRIDFFCRCNKDQFTSKLMTLGLEEIKSMKKDGHNELVCQFCNKHYIIEDSDFDKIIIELQAKHN